ncbi:MAG: ABC transporter substrate-binding protein [Ornithinimicrobium sp.]|uniref:ABC transporter substrate-binding protein n=1 Tax=Ornithinimicrobium sp. TaxID=1977084 RepID=UPI003D9BD517
MRFRTRLTVLAATLLLVATACSGGDGVDVDGGGGGGGDADGSGGGQLVAAIAAEPDQLDPHKTTAYASFQVLENVYDTLVQPDENLDMVPALAESWETSDDQLTWTFKLRDGVTFHNGDPLTAEDVVFSYNRIIDEELANSYRFEAIESVEATDDLTVEIKLKRPTPSLLAQIGAFKGMAIVHEQNVTSGAVTRNPIGTGPFKMESYTSGDSIQLAAYQDYWGDAPGLASVRYTFVSEPSVALANLQSGQVQWTDNLPPQQVASLEGQDSIEIGRVPSNDYWYFATNQARKPFDDPRVRQALAWAIDRESITEAAKFGLATMNQTAIPETSKWYYDYAPFEQDPGRAKQLLQEAGATNLTVDMMVTNEFPETIQAAQVMASQLDAVGVTLNIRTEDFATWLDQQSQGNFDAFMLGWLGNIDPDDFYYSQHHSSGSNNYQKFQNQEVDMLLDEARTETDQESRKDLYDQAVKIIVDEASYTYLYNPEVVQGWSPDLKGYTARADRAIRFHEASLGD